MVMRPNSLSPHTSFATFLVSIGLAAFLFLPHAAGAMAVGEILPLGDSITNGPGGTGGGYRARLHLLLNNAGDSFNFVGSATNNSTPALINSGQHYHEGHSGYRIDQIEGNLTGLVSSAPAFDTNNGGHWLDGGIAVGRAPIFPDLILLHIGTNDATRAGSNSNASFLAKFADQDQDNAAESASDRGEPDPADRQRQPRSYPNELQQCCSGHRRRPRCKLSLSRYACCSWCW